MFHSFLSFILERHHDESLLVSLRTLAFSGKLTYEDLDAHLKKADAPMSVLMLGVLLYAPHRDKLSASIEVTDLQIPKFCGNLIPCRSIRDCLALDVLVKDHGGSEETKANFKLLVSTGFCSVTTHEMDFTIWIFFPILAEGVPTGLRPGQVQRGEAERCFTAVHRVGARH